MCVCNVCVYFIYERIIEVCFGKIQTSLNVLLCWQWFLLHHSFMDAIFGECLLASGFMNSDLY